MHPQPEQESIFRTVFAEWLRFGGIFRRSLRATTKKGRQLLWQKSAPPQKKSWLRLCKTGLLIRKPSLYVDVNMNTKCSFFTNYWLHNVVKRSICYRNVCPRVRLSVYHNRQSRLNDSAYQNTLHTVRWSNVSTFLRSHFPLPTLGVKPNECVKTGTPCRWRELNQ